MIFGFSVDAGEDITYSCINHMSSDLQYLHNPNGLPFLFGCFFSGTRGEHTESEGGVYDISNKRRMGLTEYQAVKEMQDGILELIKLEKEAWALQLYMAEWQENLLVRP